MNGARSYLVALVVLLAAINFVSSLILQIHSQGETFGGRAIIYASRVSHVTEETSQHKIT